MREELFWDRDIKSLSPEIEIERAINFGGFDYIKEVQEKYGMEKFEDVLIKNRNLSRKAVNYWCWQLNIDKNTTKTYKTKKIWTPFR
ncbi:MAG: hypothetical protein GTN76_05790 [Candidatus Aenigmarchaeota archaeon]|nr:hypothetical protein [Candidatus Aenigmarchaeota archaeon]